MKPETERWLKRAGRHLGAARVVFEAGYLEQSIFWCQQALEVLLKAFQVESRPTNRPRRTHDLVDLGENVGASLSEEQFEFLRSLGQQYTLSRYGDEDVEYPYAVASDILERTEVLFAWLRQHLN